MWTTDDRRTSENAYAIIIVIFAYIHPQSCIAELREKALAKLNVFPSRKASASAVLNSCVSA